MKEDVYGSFLDSETAYFLNSIGRDPFDCIGANYKWKDIEKTIHGQLFFDENGQLS
jgi:hypothetical protein